MITIPNIIVSALLGSMGFTSMTDENDTQAHRLYTSILSMLIACLTGLDNAFSFNVKGANHATHARTYQKMARTIEIQLVKEVKRREDASNFIDKIVNNMEQLRETSPEIIPSILKKHPLLMNGATSKDEKISFRHKDRSQSQEMDIEMGAMVNFMTQIPPKGAVLV